MVKLTYKLNKSISIELAFYMCSIIGVKRADQIGPDRNPCRPVLNRFGPFRPTFKWIKGLLVQPDPMMDRTGP